MSELFTRTWSLVTNVSRVSGIAALGLFGVYWQSQPSVLRVTTSAPDARTLFFQAWDEGNRGNRERAASYAARAVQLDSGFGLARVLHSRVAPGSLNTQERSRQLDDGVAAAERGSRVEDMLARLIRLVYVAGDGSMFTSATSGDAGRLAGAALQRRNSTRIAARALADSVTSLVPDDPYIAYLRAGLFDAAGFDTVLARMTIRFPNFGVVHSAIAGRHELKGDLAAAERSLREYVRIAPAEPHAHYVLGQLLGRVAKHSESLSEHSRALQLDSTNADYWEASGLANARLRNHARASQHLRRAIRLEPSGEATRLLAQVHVTLGFPDSGAALFRSMLGTNPTDLTVFGALAAAYIRQDKFDSARAAFREQAERTPYEPNRVIPRAQAALVHILAGRHESAMLELEEAAVQLRQVDTRPGAGVVQYREIALIEAAFGNRDAVKSWIGRSDAMWRAIADGAGTVLNPINRAPHVRSLALTLALAGFLDEAKRFADEFDGIVTAVGSSLLAQRHELAAVIAVSEGGLARGSAELEKAGDQAYLGHAVYAEALKKAGRLQEAEAIRTHLLELAVPEPLTGYYVVAMAKARGL